MSIQANGAQVDDSDINNKTIYISMFGGFRLQVGDVVIDDNSNRARQLWNLLEYLIAFRHRDISQDELIDVLWHSEDIDNPSSALKNLVYRIRTVMSSGGIPDAKKMILCRRGTYSWNSTVPTVVDTEEFERLVKEAEALSSQPEAQIDRYLAALKLYKGDLLPKSSFEEWVLPLSTYFRGLYVKCVTNATALLGEMGRNQEILEIAEQAIIIDQFEESFHFALITAHIAMGNQQKALAQYEYVTDLFYRELGVKPSEKLRNLYREIIKTIQHVETDLEIITQDLQEACRRQGPFFCEYEVFKNIYQLESRITERTGQSIFLLLLTLTGSDGQIPQLKFLGNGMDRLKECVKASLRRNDVVARFSATQFLVMLSSLTYENSVMVQDRISAKFRRENPRGHIRIHAKLQAFDPVVFEDLPECY